MATPEQVFAYAKSEAERQGVPVDLVQNMVRAESGGDINAVSPKGAIGPMQLMPATAKDLGVNPNNWQQNVQGGVKYIGQMLSQFDDPRLAVAAYNAGPGNVRKYGDVPPFKETQKYVDKVVGMTEPKDEWTEVSGIQGANVAKDQWTEVAGIGVANPPQVQAAPMARTGPMNLDAIRQELADPNAQKFQQQFQESFNPLDVLRGKTMTGQTLTSAAKGVDRLTLQGLSFLGNKPAQDLLNEQAAQRAQVPKEPTRSISDTISQTVGAIANDPGRAFGQIGTQLLDPMALLMPGGVEKALTAAVPKSVVAAAPKLTKAGTVTATAPVMAATEGVVRAGAEGTPLNAQNLATDAATAAILGGPLALTSARATPGNVKPLTRTQDIAANAVQEGYVMTPTSLSPTFARGTAEKVMGKSDFASTASLKNIDRATNQAKEVIGLPVEQELTSQVLKAYREEQGKAYQDVRNFDYKTDKQFIKGINDEIQRLRSLTTTSPEQISTLKQVAKTNIKGDDLVNNIIDLRESGNTNIRSSDATKRSLGRTQLKAAKELESVADRFLTANGNPDIVSNFRQARQNIAQSHTIENAFDAAGNRIDPRKLAANARDDQPIPAQLRTVALAANEAPALFTPQKNWFGGRPPGAADIATGLVTSVATGNPLFAATAVARPTIREILLSGPAQRAMVPTRPTVGPVRPPSAGLRYGLAVPGLLPYVGEQ
jgi:ribosomal protein L17